ncbi:chemotaxis protein CheW [uncultured Thermanaerothrix sp.]|uniref:chemotaxis protein CheW n=1 Tax=uncultured Thermanaerothrix sp. TaxID=1195149 RepID=UPI00260EBB99|nr:chemotaxis protein CheW [uncultured Thermanaerothrix sp.]
MGRRDKLSQALDQLFSVGFKKNSEGKSGTASFPNFAQSEVPEESEAKLAGEIVRTLEASGTESLSAFPGENVVETEPDRRDGLEGQANPTKNHHEQSSQPKLSSKSDEQIVILALGNVTYGLRVEVVEAIIKMQPITRVPKTPGYIRGVTNLRGAVLPVVDLNQRLGQPQSPESPETRIVVVRSPFGLAGLVVDRVDSVRQVPASLIEPPPPMARTTGTMYLRGVVRLDEGLVLLLDLECLLQNLGTRTQGKTFYGTIPAQATLSSGNSAR